ncbi:ANTAR domain-containing protein [Streptomyces sp. NPDC000151]|uniref:ANTAR domain-containing protein n=1 Tax=Streptomyces sp. NPDC000151 TaxID=3154244 RepID=UPI00331E3B84
MTHREDHDVNPPEDTDQDLRALVAQLRRAMQTRPTIDLARGILMASFGLSPEAAWDVLVAASQNTNTKLHRLAGELVGTAQGSTLSEAVHHELRVAVAKAHTTLPNVTPQPGPSTLCNTAPEHQ